MTKPTVEELQAKLDRIKQMVCGDWFPLWDGFDQVTRTRGLIADICEQPRGNEPVPITFRRSGSTINAKNWVTFNVWYQHADRAEALLKKGS